MIDEEKIIKLIEMGLMGETDENALGEKRNPVLYTQNGMFDIIGQHIDQLADGIIRLFTQSDLEAFRMHSYEKARFYLKEAA